jgi:predicted CxxxxCH...CXXCH cytochrome family protein
MGQPKDHIAAPGTCGSCHTTFQFKNPIVNHSMLFQPCAACHNRGTVAANSADRTPPDWHRVLGMTDCESCHLPGASWSGAFMDHSRASSNSDCVACHFTFGPSGPPNPNLSTRTHFPDDDCTGCHAVP